MLIEEYIRYVEGVKRYSPRTVEIYQAVLKEYVHMISGGDDACTDDELVASMNPSEIRQYEVYLLESDLPHSARTVSLHLSALSGFCRFLMKEGRIKSNPVKLVSKPKPEKRIPQFFGKDAMDEYFNNTSHLLEEAQYGEFLKAWETNTGRDYYKKLLERMIVSTLYSLGVRRAELIGLSIGSFNFGRNVVKVHGKGDKMREIPLVASLSEEILLYLKAVETMCGRKRSLTEPLFVTYAGTPLYPQYVDRAVKSALGGQKSIKGRKSPHVLRHSLATELMNEDTDLNSIKELLGHSSLAATQVYTHSSIARLKDSYKRAHPRAKNGGKHGD